MIVITLRINTRRADPLSIVGLAETEEEIGPRAINMFCTVLGHADRGDFVYIPYRGNEDFGDGYWGKIDPTRPGIAQTAQVYTEETETPAEMIVSGHFVQVLTAEEQLRLRPHRVLIVNSKTGDRREIGFANFYMADAYAEEYDANAASLSETVFIETLEGVTVKKYG